MSHPIRAGVLLAAAAFPASAQTSRDLVLQRYDVDAMHSTVAFTATLLGAIHVRGRFPAFDATIVCDTLHPERSSVTAVIDARSITTDMSFRDDHLRSPDFLDAKQFPSLVFISDRVRPTRGGADVSGLLTLHGITRRVTFAAKTEFAPKATAGNLGRVAFSASLELSRADFGIAGTNKFNPDYDPLTNVLSDTIEVLLDLTGSRTSYAATHLGGGTPPGVGDTVNKVLGRSGAAAALETFRSVRATRPKGFRFTAGQLDVIGHQLAERGAFRDALQILSYNAELFQDQPGVLESLGEVLALSNDPVAALKSYRRAVQKFPNSSSAREMVRHLDLIGGSP